MNEQPQYTEPDNELNDLEEHEIECLRREQEQRERETPQYFREKRLERLRKGKKPQTLKDSLQAFKDLNVDMIQDHATDIQNCESAIELEYVIGRLQRARKALAPLDRQLKQIEVWEYYIKEGNTMKETAHRFDIHLSTVRKWVDEVLQLEADFASERKDNER